MNQNGADRAPPLLHQPCPTFTDQITVEVWVRADGDQPEAMQVLVSKWTVSESFVAFDAFDAGATAGLNCTGYFGAVFDGRYVYFVPQQHSDLSTHGVVLRYDTHGAFDNPASYSAYDAGQTSGLNTKGYYGAAFDGSYVYFIPRQIDHCQYHSRLMRYDVNLEFKDPAAWDAFDIGERHSHQSCAFDGRYIYMCPGYTDNPEAETNYSSRVVCYDTRAELKRRESYTVVDISAFLGPRAACYDGAVFDGRYVYLVPLSTSLPARYDTRGEIDAPASWQAFDAKPLNMGMNVGAVFDGRYVYYAAYLNSVIARFDTTGDFTDRDSWQAFDARETDGLATDGFDGTFFDGRFVYFVPFVRGHEDELRFHSNFLRYDPQGAFDDSTSWRAHDASRASGLISVGYNGGAFDGRYFYCAPWQRGPGEQANTRLVHGVILRYDTLGGKGTFSLRYCDVGHNGGLCAAVGGPSFLVNTDRGVISASWRQRLLPGEHHLAGVYDGRCISLFIDGKRAAQREASGRIVNNDEPVALGHMYRGLGRLGGEVRSVGIRAATVNDEYIRQAYCAGPPDEQA